MREGIFAHTEDLACLNCGEPHPGTFACGMWLPVDEGEGWAHWCSRGRLGRWHLAFMLYQMPEGDWAFAHRGTVSDGYETRDGAIQAAQEVERRYQELSYELSGSPD